MSTLSSAMPSAPPSAVMRGAVVRPPGRPCRSFRSWRSWSAIPGVDWAHATTSSYGCANQAGEDNRNVARMAALLAGLVTAPRWHRQPALRFGPGCGRQGGARDKGGEAELMVAGGVESMTRAPFVMGKATCAFSRSAVFDTTIGWRFVNTRWIHLRHRFHAVTAENVAGVFGVSREDQDRSH